MKPTSNVRSPGSLSLANRIWTAPYLLLTFTALFWAGNSIVARAARDLVPPLALSFWRWSLALLLLLPLAWPYLRRDAAELRRSWRTLVVLGTLGPVDIVGEPELGGGEV